MMQTTPIYFLCNPNPDLDISRPRPRHEDNNSAQKSLHPLTPTVAIWIQP